jgi:hypothetical protein
MSKEQHSNYRSCPVVPLLVVRSFVRLVHHLVPHQPFRS